MDTLYRVGDCLNCMRRHHIEVNVNQLTELIDLWILNDRNRQILKQRLVHGVKFEPLAEEFELSVRQVKNIVYKEQEKIFKHLKTVQ